jgi:hypothetical protein
VCPNNSQRQQPKKTFRRRSTQSRGGVCGPAWRIIPAGRSLQAPKSQPKTGANKWRRRRERSCLVFCECCVRGWRSCSVLLSSSNGHFRGRAALEPAVRTKKRIKGRGVCTTLIMAVREQNSSAVLCPSKCLTLGDSKSGLETGVVKCLSVHLAVSLNLPGLYKNFFSLLGSELFDRTYAQSNHIYFSSRFYGITQMSKIAEFLWHLCCTSKFALQIVYGYFGFVFQQTMLYQLAKI